jgi:8-oxo-dGTP diphosphatase
MESREPKPIVVLAALIRRGETYLITRRRADAGSNPSRWEFPGGKLEFGEDPRDGLAREIKEETSLTVRPGEIIGYSSYVYGGTRHIILLGFLCDVADGTVAHIGIEDHRWLTPEQISAYDLTEADLPLVELLRLRHGLNARE